MLILVLLTVLGWLGWSGWVVHRYARLEAALEKSANITNLQSHPADTIQAAITSLEEAVEAWPCDAEARFRLAKLHVLHYRAQAMEQILATKSANPGAEEREAIWHLTAPVFLHRRAEQLRSTDMQRFERLRQQPLIVHNLKPAVRNLLIASHCCPMMSKVQIALAELSIALPDHLSAEQFVRESVRLAPNDPDILFRCGLFDLQSGRIPGGLTKCESAFHFLPAYMDRSCGWARNWSNARNCLPEPFPTFRPGSLKSRNWFPRNNYGRNWRYEPKPRWTSHHFPWQRTGICELPSASCRGMKRRPSGI